MFVWYTLDGHSWQAGVTVDAGYVAAFPYVSICQHLSPSLITDGFNKQLQKHAFRLASVVVTDHRCFMTTQRARHASTRSRGLFASPLVYTHELTTCN